MAKKIEVVDMEERIEAGVKKGLKIGGGLFVGLLAIIAFFSFVVIIPAGEVGVLFDKLNGGVQLEEFNGGAEGLGFKIPFVQSVIKMDVRTRTVEFRADQAITPKDMNGINFKWDVVVRYKLDRTQAAEVYKTKGEDFAGQIIGTGIRAKAREVLGAYPQEQLPEKRLELADKMRVALQLRVDEEIRGIPELKEGLLVIQSIDLRNLEFHPEIEQKIIQKQQRLQEAQERQYNLQIAEKDREIAVVQADAIRQKAVLEAEGRAEAILLEATAKAKGINLVNDAYQQMPSQYVQVKYAEAIKATDKVYLGFDSLSGNTLGVMNYNQLLGLQNTGTNVLGDSK